MLRMFMCLALALSFGSTACKKDSKNNQPNKAEPTGDNHERRQPVDKARPKGNKPELVAKRKKPNLPAPGMARAYGEDFDRTCKADADCVLESTSRCSHCGCTDFGINAREQKRFRDVATAFKCPPEDPAEAEDDCGGCPGYVPVCTDGLCKAEAR